MGSLQGGPVPGKLSKRLDLTSRDRLTAEVETTYRSGRMEYVDGVARRAANVDWQLTLVIRGPDGRYNPAVVVFPPGQRTQSFNGSGKSERT